MTDRGYPCRLCPGTSRLWRSMSACPQIPDEEPLEGLISAAGELDHGMVNPLEDRRASVQCLQFRLGGDLTCVGLAERVEEAELSVPVPGILL